MNTAAEVSATGAANENKFQEESPLVKAKPRNPVMQAMQSVVSTVQNFYETAVETYDFVDAYWNEVIVVLAIGMIPMVTLLVQRAHKMMQTLRGGVKQPELKTAEDRNRALFAYLNSMTINGLKEELMARGLAVSGLKEDLKNRVIT